MLYSGNELLIGIISLHVIVALVAASSNDDPLGHALAPLLLPLALLFAPLLAPLGGAPRLLPGIASPSF
jgi:hypothetical protein